MGLTVDGTSPEASSIRIPFWSGGSLRAAGAAVAESESPDLYAFQPFRIMDRLDQNQAVIARNYLSIMSAARDGELITPAAEWLIDNHHVVEENFRHLRRDLTPSFYRHLPQITLVNGQRVPRAFALAWQYVAIVDSEISLAGLTEMVEGYQTRRVLTIGELWAVPALLRFVLLENLRRQSEQVDSARRQRLAANALADQMLIPAGDGGVALLLATHVAEAREDTFASQLVYRFRDGTQISREGTAWLDARLAERGTTAERMVALEHARQSASNVSSGNIIRSLRLVDDVDWLTWFEKVSAVDRVLRQSSDYGRLDKPSRNSYRDTVERVARHGRLDEVEVAEKAVALARTERPHDPDGFHDADGPRDAGGRPDAIGPDTTGPGSTGPDDRDTRLTPDAAQSARIPASGEGAAESLRSGAEPERRFPTQPEAPPPLQDAGAGAPLSGTPPLASTGNASHPDDRRNDRSLILPAQAPDASRAPVSSEAAGTLSGAGDPNGFAARPTEPQAQADAADTRTGDAGSPAAPPHDAPHEVGPEVGRVLVGDRLGELEQACGYRTRFGERCLRFAQRLGWPAIFVPVLVLSVIIAGLLALTLPAQPMLPLPVSIVLILLALVPASDAAMALVSLVSSRLVPPARLPAYDYTDAIPPEARTLVVIPSLLTDYDTIDDLLGNLERHYLANPRGEVSFALLSDWADAAEETQPSDDELVAYARNGIDLLAERYAHDGRRRFFLLHRRRLFNAAEGVWMGWERKRGKLSELNQLLEGEGDTTFLDTGPRPPDGVRYVVTLDADTRLPRDSIADLVGKIDNPVNRPRNDPKTGLVTRGHGILQPRVTPSLTSGAESSVFQRVFSANRGLDPYVFAVSDLYQDLLDEGSFTGKGIYDVRAFDAAIDNRLPENAVLSHDLIEGSLARAALVSDVQVIEDFPTRYEVDVSRQHRWARGDWQLLPFILDPTNGLNGVARLKMVDNLRRTLVPIAWVLASAIGWLTMPFNAALWWQVGLVLTFIFVPLANFLIGVVPRQRGTSARSHIHVVLSEGRGLLVEFGLRLTFMAHLAVKMGDAIVRALYRMFVSRKHLLEWRTAQQVHVSARSDLKDYLRYMWISPVIGLGLFVAVALLNPAGLAVALPFALIWTLAPLAAWEVSRPLATEDRLNIRPADRDTLRRTARLTWRYFETFVTAESNWLPPDNFQEAPAPKIAERTSPTNIGLYLLSVLTARDFGWISFEVAVGRIEQSLGTLERMEKYRGHLYNWYDTANLAVLEPRYVSAVDSGNLAGHLVTLSSALREWSRNPSVNMLGNLDGIGDVLALVRERHAAVPDDRRTLRPLRRRIEERIDGFARSLASYLDEPQLAPVRAINLAVIAEDIRKLSLDLEREAGHATTAELVWWANALKATCDAMTGDSLAGWEEKDSLAERLAALAERARSLAFAMDFRFLMDPEKRLLSIGYRPDLGERDLSCYDLLASEARLASFFAIAKGDLPVEHWTRLGRPVTAFEGRGVLLSWSGSMFEYLMPPLVMQERVGGILNQSNAMAVAVQIQHGNRLGIPWGVSESAFNARDREMNYQYYAFGVPELGLKRTVGQDVVVAPYATLLASQIRPHAAVANLRRLEKMGAFGPQGAYDAVDFTPSRLQEGAKYAVVRNYMAHHHGMSIVAIGNSILDGIHRTRFHDDPVIKAAELLLQEKAPREIVPLTRSDSASSPAHVAGPEAQPLNVAPEPEDNRNAVAILSNGHHSVMLSTTGAGYMTYGRLAVTRWRPDPTFDHGGSFLFLRDTASGMWWSASTSPRRAKRETAGAVFSDHKAEFHKVAHGIDSRMEVIVAAEANAEGRRIVLRNLGTEARTIEITSYGEIVLDRAEADAAHPAFSKMFIRTEVWENGRVITARRNRRTAGDRQLHLAHFLSGPPEGRGTEFETDRRAFIGRGRTLGTAAAFDQGAELTGATGFTLDPIFSLRRRIRILPRKEASLIFWTVVTDTAEELERAVAHYSRAETFEHESRLAWTYSQVQLRHLDIPLEEAALFRRYAALLVYPDLSLTAMDAATQAAMGPQSALWPAGISGDVPIFLLRLDSEADLPIVRKALRMHLYFRARGVLADLVILNERATSYSEQLQDEINALSQSYERRRTGEGGNVYVLRRDMLGRETLDTLLAAARISIHARNGRLSEQIHRLDTIAEESVAPKAPPPALPVKALPPPAFPEEALRFWNGYGGFSADGRSYVVRLRHGEATPHPWINVIARGAFGFHVSATGAGFTWSVNSRDHQITPWSNDPVIDPPGEGFFIHDTESGRIATPFAGLSDDPLALYEVRHGFGQTTFRAFTDWLEVEAVQTLHADQPAKLTRLTLHNRSGRTLRLRVAGYAECVLGQNRSRTAPMIRFRRLASGGLAARNPFATEAVGHAAVFTCDRVMTGFLGSRTAFFGRGGNLRRPAALVDGWPGSSLETEGDPCAVLISEVTLPPGASRSVTFALGDGEEADVDHLPARVLGEDAWQAALAAAAGEWRGITDTLQVSTPDPKLDLMINGWLPYQAIACRIRARSAFYQASGAFGFRDQLQDTSALLLQDPSLARAQILNAAGRQFPEGDVQHWWLPATGAGVRTMISDDVVWLGHLTERYVAATGDTALLDHPLPWLEGRRLEEGEHDAFYTPGHSAETAPLYEHCARALDLAVERTGANGLPLILGGDWNDGMNRVGEKGRGESVWLGWFLATTLDAFAPFARARGEAERADRWQAHRERLAQALEAAGWDGGWYRRGYYDDGAPLGSQESDACRIDSIAQSWAAISGIAPEDHATIAVDAALSHLVDTEAGLIRLFQPPFVGGADGEARDPGYIQGYPPGVRENGGQYTHAAAWMVYALARMGRGSDAHGLFDMINPVSHAENRAEADRYRVEPYVVAADVYGIGDKRGRGGWTWYTGSAGWLYRAAVEGILGITLADGNLRVEPNIPPDWPGYEADIRLPDGRRYHVAVTRQDGSHTVEVTRQTEDAADGAAAPVPRDAAETDSR
ncbi:protein ndvB [Haematobacter missouriensis]|uniref:Protein ndvB n=1 Tax=Haematobacter missouriensis TaxID=366616 RepID=A0ABX3ZZW1_9RHOB|nr:protein ndvB [Haematobacter missouriensis]OWJ80062.1 protein ndvB [Haematobacter missouriensis]